MEYTYSLQEKARKNFILTDLINESGYCALNILCYHVETQSKYPFLQFMMQKLPFCNNVFEEHFVLPFIFINNVSNNITELVLNYVKTHLKLLNCDCNIDENMYKGIIFSEDTYTPYALVNITGIDIYGLNFQRQTPVWFSLVTEIINNNSICDIPIDEDVINLFTDFPEIGLLYNKHTNNPYLLPDAVYTCGDIKNAEFCSVFGNCKTKIYDSCNEYYYFYRSFNLAIKECNFFNEKLIENNNLKYINRSKALNRYALFVEGKIYMECGTEFSLTDKVIETLYPEPCIIICYSNIYNTKPDILVKKYEGFVCLSYHRLHDIKSKDCFIE